MGLNGVFMYYGEYFMYLGSRHHLKSRYLQRGKWGTPCVSVGCLLVYLGRYHVSTMLAPGRAHVAQIRTGEQC